MRAFQFPLAAVARVRELEESVAREKFMTALRDLRLAQQGEVIAQRDLEKFRLPTGALESSQMKWAMDQSERYRESVQSWRKRVATAGEASIEARRKYLEAEKKAEVLRRLEGRARERWLEEMLRREAAELDEFSVSRARSGGQHEH